MNAREAAYLALLASLREEKFISYSLEQWQTCHNPSSADFALAQEIAYGSARQALFLDYIAAQLSTQGKLSLKLKEKALIRTAIYQHACMSKVPLYAIVNETIEIAKKYCHRTFISYLNALLRKLDTQSVYMPQGNSPQELSIRFSYPPSFIAALIEHYGLLQTIEILHAGNRSPATMVRLRPKANELPLPAHLLSIPHACTPMATLANASHLNAVSISPNYYIQNITPATLIAELASHTKTPQRILDLCASPGGKLLAAHDCFPSAQLFANDITEEKIKRLSQNFAKYTVPLHLSCSLGEEFTSPQAFDVIILDVPCSNSGVLNKRPEARWRLTPEALKALEGTQQRLLRHASTLLAKEGAIWYLTCSILKQENEQAVESFCQATGRKPLFSKTILPSAAGWDGGFACLLQ